MKNFTDFMIDATQDSALGNEVINKLNEGDHTVLASWFQEKGYEVHEDECKKLHENKELIKRNQTVGISY